MCPQETPTETPTLSTDLTRLSRRQAERVAGVSRATLARYLADGRLSATKGKQGNNVYDAAELARIFPDTFDLKRLETSASRGGISSPETGETPARDSGVIGVLQVEKRYITEERDQLRQEVERLRRELADERDKREAERSNFMDLLRQNQAMVRQITNQRENVEQALRFSKAASSIESRGLLARLLEKR